MSGGWLVVLGAALVGAGFGLILPPITMAQALRFVVVGPLATLIVWRWRT